MNASRLLMASFRALTATVLLGSAAMTFAAEPPSSQTTPSPAPSKEMREQMAVAHERMASCLRSDRTFTECRQQMQQNCSQMMGEQGCMMMGPGMGMGKRRGMTPPQE